MFNQLFLFLLGRQVDPPPRQVIVERMAAAAQAPQDIIIERW